MKWSTNFDTKYSLAPLRPKESNRKLLLVGVSLIETASTPTQPTYLVFPINLLIYCMIHQSQDWVSLEFHEKLAKAELL